MQTATKAETYPSGCAIPAHRRVVLRFGHLQLAGPQDIELGVTQNATSGRGQLQVVRLAAPDTDGIGTSTGVLHVGDEIYCASNGKFAAGGLIPAGVAMSSTTFDGDTFRFLRNAE